MSPRVPPPTWVYDLGPKTQDKGPRTSPLPEYRFTCSLLNGLHARPASMLVEVASRFAAAVTLSKVLAPRQVRRPHQRPQRPLPRRP